MFTTSLHASSPVLHLAGAVANPVVNAFYPLPTLTRWHAQHHLPGLTGRWMDTGATTLGGMVRGPFHRFTHGHHFLDDGLKVILHPRLRYGEFLHHLGLDFLTRTGIPNPLLPKVLGEVAMTLGKRLGIPSGLLHDLLTVNAPKILGGGLTLVCAGPDVVAAFSDAIPHTFKASGLHLAMGMLDCALGCYPPNPLLLVAGAAELGVGTVTAVRAWTDPLLPALGMPQSVFLPLLGQAMGLAGAFAFGCGAMLTGSLAGGVRQGVCASMAAGASVTVSTLAKVAAIPFAPLAGPAAGFLLYRLARHLLDPASSAPEPPRYQSFEEIAATPGFTEPRILPALVPARRAFGRIENSRLWLHGPAPAAPRAISTRLDRVGTDRPPRMSAVGRATSRAAKVRA